MITNRTDIFPFEFFTAKIRQARLQIKLVPYPKSVVDPNWGGGPLLEAFGIAHNPKLIADRNTVKIVRTLFSEGL